MFTGLSFPVYKSTFVALFHNSTDSGMHTYKCTDSGADRDVDSAGRDCPLGGL